MARNKHPEVTVNRILKSAEKLFIEKGYEHTTIQDIVDDLGDLSKGAIYHHFKGKAEIMDAVTSNFYPADFDQYLQGEPDGLSKLKKLFRYCIVDSPQKEMLSAMKGMRNNPKLLVKHLYSTMEEVPAILVPYIEEGVADGSIHTDSPQEAAEVIMLLINIWMNPILCSIDAATFSKRIQYVRTLCDSIGMPIFDDELVASLAVYHELIK